MSQIGPTYMDLQTDKANPNQASDSDKFRIIKGFGIADTFIHLNQGIYRAF